MFDRFTAHKTDHLTAVKLIYFLNISTYFSVSVYSLTTNTVYKKNHLKIQIFLRFPYIKSIDYDTQYH